MIPYGRQDVNREDIDAVVDVLQSDWLTTGPAVEEFEQALEATIGGDPVVAVSSGTAALHTAYAAAGKPTRPTHLTCLKLVTGKKNESADLAIDDIAFYRVLPESLAGKVQAP